MSLLRLQVDERNNCAINTLQRHTAQPTILLLIPCLQKANVFTILLEERNKATS